MRPRDPARRHGCVLRVASSCAGGPSSRGQPVVVGGTGRAASWRRRRTRPGGSACTRRCRRPSPGGCARTRCSCPATTPLTARSAPRCTTIFGRYTPLVEPLVARRGVPRRHRRDRGCSATAPRSRGRIRDRCRDELGLALLGRRRPEQVPGQVGVRGRQAAARRRRGSIPGRGVVEVVPGQRAGVPPPAPGRRAVGRRPGHARAARTARHPHRR